MACWARGGVGPAGIFARWGKQGIEDVGLDDLALLFALHNQIREGDASIDDVFPAPGSTPTAKAASALTVSGTDDAKAKLKARRRKKGDDEAPPPPTPTPVAALAPPAATPQAPLSPKALLAQAAERAKVNGIRLLRTIQTKYGVGVDKMPEPLALSLADLLEKAATGTLNVITEGDQFDVTDDMGRSMLPAGKEAVAA